MLNAHDAGRARRVDELVAADRDCDVRRFGTGRREEDDIARREVLRLHRFPDPKLLAYRARQRHAVLREDVLGEAAAVEALGIAAAIQVPDSTQRQRRSDQRVPVDIRPFGTLGPRPGRGEGS